MKRWWLLIALLLSVGINVGILAAIATRRATRPDPPPPAREERGPRLAPPLPDEDSEPGPGQPQGGPPRASRLADRLGLEGEPRRRFLAIQQTFFEETVRIRLHLAETQREVRRELMSETPDRPKIDALLQESAQDFLALERALAKNVVSSRELLDPAQEEEYLLVISRLRPQAPAPGLGQTLQQQPQRGREPMPPWQERQLQRQEDRLERRLERNERMQGDRGDWRHPDDRRPPPPPPPPREGPPPPREGPPPML